MLRDFILAHREEILAGARSRVAKRSPAAATPVIPIRRGPTAGLPVFLDDLREALRKVSSHELLDHDALETSARQHGRELFLQGMTAAQVVHDYGDLCQVITGLAVEQHVSIASDELRTLNHCLDDAIAGAVTAHCGEHERAIAAEETKRLGVLAHEMRNILSAAVLSFGSIKKGSVTPAGGTATFHDRSLSRLSTMIDRSVGDVAGAVPQVERVPVWEVIEEVQLGALLLAQARGLRLEVTAGDRAVIVEADRHSLAGAVTNLVQNALKFTRGGSTVSLRATATTSRVLIEVEDECGGLPKARQESLLRPFVQKGHDRTGLGLGLSICAKAVSELGGELLIRDLPGKGCVFAIDLPKLPPPTTRLAQESNG